jgi:hypothetical protein
VPVLSALFASANETTTTSATFVAAAETAALASGVEYLCIVTANTIAGNNTTCEIEASFGATRYGFTRWRAGFTGAPNSGTGGQMQVAFRVTGDGASTLALRHRRESGTQTVNTTASVACIPLDSLTEGTHYWAAEGANSDTLTNPAAGSGWNGSGQSVDVAPAATGNFLVIGGAEAEFTAGHTAADTALQRLRVTEDPAGSPVSHNLMRSTSPEPGPETAITGGSPWGNYAHSQRFVDVVSLTAGTTYRFEPQWQAEAATANTGYRRARVFVFDLSVWAEFAFARDVDGVASGDHTFATCAVGAPSAARDYCLLGSFVHCNNNTWTFSNIRLDPDGTPSDIGGPFGIALVDAGNAAGDDYALIGLQADLQGQSAAFDIASRFVGTLNSNNRLNHTRGLAPNAADDGIAALTIAWGMETTTTPSTPSNITGASSGAASTSSTIGGVGALSGTASGSASTTGTLEGHTSGLSGTASGGSTASATLRGVGAVVGVAAAAATVAATIGTAAFADQSASGAWIGNSYTQDYGSLPDALQHVLDERIPTNTTSLGPPPDLGTSISQFVGGYFAGMTLGGMALYDEVDQSQTAGTTDAVDAVNSLAPGAYDFVVLTSGFRQESRPGDAAVNDDTAVAREILPGAGGTGTDYDVCLEVTRRVVSQLASGGSTARTILRMTHEGQNANQDTDLADIERFVRLQCLGARQLESEGVVDLVVPDHYVWSRLQLGKFGTALAGLDGPVPSYASLVHDASQQPGNANVSWLNRTSGDTAPFPLNTHQNAIATIVQAWVYAYAVWGLDPRGDTSFDTAAGLPAPLNNMISPDGTRIYGGQNSGDGNLPYDTGVNPGGPPDSQLDLAWNATVRSEIQDRIVAAVDDWNAGATEFDGLGGSITGTSAGAGTVAGTIEGVGAVVGTSTSSSTASSSITAIGDLHGSAAGIASATASVLGIAPDTVSGTAVGGSTATASVAGFGRVEGSAFGVASASCALGSDLPSTGTASGSSTAACAIGGVGRLTGSVACSATATAFADGTAGALFGSTSGTSSASAQLVGVGRVEGVSAGTSTATLIFPPTIVIAGVVELVGTTLPAVCAATTLPVEVMGTPWYVHPQDEGPQLRQRVQNPAVTSENGRTVQTKANPVDLSDVSGVVLQVWDSPAASWIAVSGVGLVDTETLAEDDSNEAGTYYLLTFSPAVGALQTLTDTVGRGTHPMRWVLTRPSGEQTLPSVGWETIVIASNPS